MTALELSDAQRRLLAMVAERLPDGQVRELYLFAPIRQGGVETGLAVIAATEPADAATELTADEAASVVPSSDASDIVGETAVVVAAADLTAAPACASEDATVVRAAVLAAEAAVAAPGPDAPACDPTEEAAGPPPSDAGMQLDGEAEVAEPPAVVTSAEAAAGQSAGGADGIDAAVALDAGEAPTAAAAPVAPERYTVYTARYRLQLKGPERGKWAVELVAEADAPLLTVDAVVRGVQRRAGEVAEVERLTGPDVARLLGTSS